MILVKDSAQEFGFTQETMPHPSGEKLLCLYKYIKSTGIVEKNVHKNMTELKNENASDMSLERTIKGWAGAPGSSSGPLAIKMENPTFAKFKENLGILNSGKAALEKQITASENACAMMVAKASQNEDLKKPAHDFEVLGPKIGGFQSRKLGGSLQGAPYKELLLMSPF